jgi:hypothetical protein
MKPLLDHAARVLDHQPTRSMEAEPLYRRAVRESGVDLSFPRFMAAVRERTDRFAVIPPDPILGCAEAWDARQRSLYQAALEAAGRTQPLIVLTERPVDPVDLLEPRAAPGTAADVFGDVHDALTHLLRSVDPDDSLHAAVSAAMDDLHAVQRALRP